ncbi:hypothetical protein FACS1894145_3990 [Bacteroidia bacterium]|nr:hypothetical protein FACS1894145_3990 [Bacteroidia bacterium]
MKKQYKFIWISLLLFHVSFFSCVDENYSLDSISKDGVISHDKGLFVPIGSLDTIRFQTFEMSNPVEVTYIKTVEGLFSGDLYKNFVIPVNGVEKAIGSLSFSGDFVPGIANSASKDFSDIVISAQFLKKNGDNAGIRIADQTLKTAGSQPQAFDLIIAEEDVIKLKDSYSLRLIFVFSAKQVEDDDYLVINNLNLKSSGGIRINWD